MSIRSRLAPALSLLIAAYPSLVIAQSGVSVFGGVALGKRDVERLADPYTGQPSNYYWYPDSAAHPQFGASLQGWSRFVGIRATVAYLSAGVFDLTANGSRLYLCNGVPCPEGEKTNPLPGHTVKYVGVDLDLLVRAWRPTAEVGPGSTGVPFDVYLLVGPGVRRRLHDQAVDPYFEQPDKVGGTITFGGGTNIVFPVHAGLKAMFIEYRHSRGVSKGDSPLSIGPLRFTAPNREATNIVRMGLVL